MQLCYSDTPPLPDFHQFSMSPANVQYFLLDVNEVCVPAGSLNWYWHVCVGGAVYDERGYVIDVLML